MPYRITAHMEDTPVISAGPTRGRKPTWVVTFKGSVDVSGSPGDTEITYKFLRSDGAIDRYKRKLHFPTPGGTQQVTTTWTLGDLWAEKGLTGWLAIKIISPVQVESNKASFALSRSTTAGIVQPQPQPEIKEMNVWLVGQPVGPQGGIRPYVFENALGYFTLLAIQLVQGQRGVVAINLVKLGHSTAECGDPKAVVQLMSGQWTTDSEMMALFGSDTPAFSPGGKIVACASTTEVVESIAIRLRYRS